MSDDDSKFGFAPPEAAADAAEPPAKPPGSNPTHTDSQRARRPGLWQPPTPEELQEQLPQYRVLSLLGRGGMGAVYKGWQTSLDRHVAIKILPPQLGDEGEAQFAARFKQEAKTMAKFSHPGIVGVYDAGETAAGLLYIVMEFIEGTDVAQMIKAAAPEGAMPPAHALAITAHVCDALAYAHDHGVIHRDIKPANIMLNMQGAVKVADFGLAKSTAPGAGGLTRTDMAMGTPDFIAPEALISGVLVDHRADLYAVGVMLYQMLTGKVPRGHFDPPSTLAPGVDPRFDAIVLKAMKQDREQRYQSASQIRRDLDEILAMPAVPQGGPDRTSIPKPGPQPGGAARPQVQPQTRASLQSKLRQGRDHAQSSPRSRPWLIPATLTGIAVLCLGAYAIFKPRILAPPATPETGVLLQSSGPAPRESSPPPDLAARTGTPETGIKPLPAQPAAPEKPIPISPPKPEPVKLPPPGGVAAMTAAPTKTLPAEVAALDDQFLKLRDERVTKPFAAELEKLDSGYIGALERAVADEKKAGQLDGVMALEGEKARMAARQGVPETDAPGTPESLKKLRAIYRNELPKLEQQRAANLKALTDPLIKHLQRLEADFTRQDRIADAQLARAYRTRLGPVEGQAGSTVARPPPGSPAPGAPAPQPGKARDETSRTEAVGMLLEMGARVNVRVTDATTGADVADVSQLPSPFRAYHVEIDGRSTRRLLADADLGVFAILPECRIVSLNHQSDITPAGFARLSTLTRINHLQVEKTGFDDSCAKTLADLPSLAVIHFDDTKITDKTVETLAARKNYVVLDFTNCAVTDASAATLAGFRSLNLLILRGTGLSAEGVARIRNALPNCKIDPP